ncbi:hypothetical protein PC116_g32173, partial [Phytophthora cactorum]
MLDEYGPSSPLSGDLTDYGTPEPTLPRPSTSVQQPIFHKAPRFKPIESPDGGSLRGDPLPDVFSPHRRGTKYVPGGLAALVRDWFIDVWAGATTGVNAKHDGDKKEWTARILVEGVQGSAGMTLVTGRHVMHEDDDDDDDLTTSTKDKDRESDATMGNARIVLAGSQKVVGLEKGLE